MRRLQNTLDNAIDTHSAHQLMTLVDARQSAEAAAWLLPGLIKTIEAVEADLAAMDSQKAVLLKAKIKADLAAAEALEAAQKAGGALTAEQNTLKMTTASAAQAASAALATLNRGIDAKQKSLITLKNTQGRLEAIAVPELTEISEIFALATSAIAL